MTYHPGPGFQEREQRLADSGHPTGGRHRPFPAFQAFEFDLQGVDGRIAAASIGAVIGRSLINGSGRAAAVFAGVNRVGSEISTEGRLKMWVHVIESGPLGFWRTLPRCKLNSRYS